PPPDGFARRGEEWSARVAASSAPVHVNPIAWIPPQSKIPRRCRSAMRRASACANGRTIRRNARCWANSIACGRSCRRRNPGSRACATIPRRARVLCLDEFMVQDIGDAMILANLLRALFKQRVALVATSNTAPRDLYRDGLQRARFLPAIALIERHCQVLELASPHDWRLRALTHAPVYLTPPGVEAERALSALFDSLARGPARQGGALRINEREIPVRRAARAVAWFDFA